MVYVYTSDLQNVRMEEVLDRDETLDAEIEQLTDREVFTEIWTRPRRVFRFINATEYQAFWYILVAMAGVARTFDGFEFLSNTTGSVLIKVGAGAALGWFGIYITAAVVSWISGQFGGKGNTSQMYRCFVYAYLPMALLAPVRVVFEVFLIQSGFYDSLLSITGEFDNSYWFVGSVALGAASLAALLYSVVLLVVATSEIQRISLTKSTISVIIPLSLGVIASFLALVR